MSKPVVVTAKEGINPAGEFVFLKAATLQYDFTLEIQRDQYRALWTAYCLHAGLDVDTCKYDNDLWTLWQLMEEDLAQDDANGLVWCDFEAFDDFMCEWLV